MGLPDGPPSIIHMAGTNPTSSTEIIRITQSQGHTTVDPSHSHVRCVFDYIQVLDLSVGQNSNSKKNKQTNKQWAI